MSDYILKDFPGKEDLLTWSVNQGTNRVLEVNGHLHTPFSFSAFDSVESIFSMASQEEVSVLGINDFYVMDGYQSFYRESLSANIFPLFNIEFIGLLKEEQEKEIRINDPNNPGRTYFSGKGLDYPPAQNESVSCLLKNLKFESQVQVKEMIDKVNMILQEINVGLHLKYSEIKRLHAQELVRERHIAKAIRALVLASCETDEQRMTMLEQLYGTKKPASLSDPALLENEIRSNLLKAGGRAFVPEDDNAFLSLEQIISVILQSGGIPCYPVLLDNKEGKCTEYESDRQLLLNELISRNIYCIELIPGRNDHDYLKEFVLFFRDNGFIITFGTEHNTPSMMPLKVTARGGRELDPELKEISYEGACVIAAHQYLRAQGLDGYVNGEGLTRHDELTDFISLGKAVIERFLQTDNKE